MASVASQQHQVPLDTIPISPESKPTDGSDAPAPKSAGGADTSDKPVTVFHDADNFNVKHPLMCPWTLWFTKPPSGKVSYAVSGSCGSC